MMYQRKHPPVEAVQITEEMFRDHYEHATPLPYGLYDYDPVYGVAYLDTSRSTPSAGPGDWIIDPHNTHARYVVSEEEFCYEFEPVPCAVASTTPRCTLAPVGWYCSRPAGHSGPCDPQD
jgi:hypothetical protein